MLLPLAAILGSCIEFNIDPIEKDRDPNQRATVTEVFVQAPLPKVDLLFVVDRTPSMDQELGALVAAADALGAQLDEAGVAWQVGVVGTEMAGAEAGWLLGHPWVLTPVGDVGGHLDALLAVPPATTGESGLAAAIRALQLAVPGDVNQGLRRPDAGLHVVFFSDADDSSDAWLSDPVQAMLDRLALEGANGMPAMASAVVGDAPGGCTSAFGSATAGTRYRDVAQASGGEVVSICATNFAPIVERLTDASIVLQTVFPLRELPAGQAITVSIDGVVVGGWTLDPAVPAVVFDLAPPAGAEIEVTYVVKVEA